MKNKENNPFDIILSVTPNFSEEEAINIANQHYNLIVSAENLVSERDQNFLLTTKKQKKYVLKIANSEEDPSVTDFQICALMHINNKNDIPMQLHMHSVEYDNLYDYQITKISEDINLSFDSL